jgi:uncharacterized integral membrane protein (TIGR00697 family)
MNSDIDNSIDIGKFPKFIIPLAMLYCLSFIFPFLMAYRPMEFGWLLLAGGTSFFIASYSIGDMIAEIYGYPIYRVVVWSSLFVQIVLTIFIYGVLISPHPKDWDNTVAFWIVFGHSFRYLVASTLGNFVGDFVNGYCLSKMKILLRGNHFWMRSLASTFIGETLQTIIVFIITFIGLVSHGDLLRITVSTIVFKIVYACIFVYFTNIIVKKIKKIEGLDVYDHGVNYNPFKF